MTPAKKAKQLTPEEALVRLENLCARGERCSYEIREKLRKWNIDISYSEKILQSLQTRRFVDDARFTRSFVNDKVKFARWGERKIYMALLAKRIDRSLIKEELKNIDIDLIKKNLTELLLLKARTLGDDAKTYEGRTRLFRFAVGRGYNPEMISNVIKENFV